MDFNRSFRFVLSFRSLVSFFRFIGSRFHSLSISGATSPQIGIAIENAAVYRRVAVEVGLLAVGLIFRTSLSLQPARAI